MVTRDWYAVYSPIMARISASAGDLVGKSLPANPVPAASLSSYVGSMPPLFGSAEISEMGERPSGVQDRSVGRPYKLTHWEGDVFSVSPSSENQTDGSLSSVTFKQAGKEPARELTIEYLDGNGLGLFLRR